MRNFCFSFDFPYKLIYNVFVFEDEKWHLFFDNHLLCLWKRPKKKIVIDYGKKERKGKRRERVGEFTPPVWMFFFFFLVWGRGYIRKAPFNSLKLGEFERIGFQFF